MQWFFTFSLISESGRAQLTAQRPTESECVSSCSSGLVSAWGMLIPNSKSVVGVHGRGVSSVSAAQSW